MHVVVVDDTGSVTGIKGNILEKNTFLSKASDTVSALASPERTYYKDYLALGSKYIYGGGNVSAATDEFHGTTPVAVGFSTMYTPLTTGQGLFLSLIHI